jgi:hypothetical protein
MTPRSQRRTGSGRNEQQHGTDRGGTAAMQK